MLDVILKSKLNLDINLLTKIPDFGIDYVFDKYVANNKKVSGFTAQNLKKLKHIIVNEKQDLSNLKENEFTLRATANFIVKNLKDFHHISFSEERKELHLTNSHSMYHFNCDKTCLMTSHKHEPDVIKLLSGTTVTCDFSNQKLKITVADVVDKCLACDDQSIKIPNTNNNIARHCDGCKEGFYRTTLGSGTSGSESDAICASCPAGFWRFATDTTEDSCERCSSINQPKSAENPIDQAWYPDNGECKQCPEGRSSSDSSLKTATPPLGVSAVNHFCDACHNHNQYYDSVNYICKTCPTGKANHYLADGDTKNCSWCNTLYGKSTNSAQCTTCGSKQKTYTTPADINKLPNTVENFKEIYETLTARSKQRELWPVKPGSGCWCGGDDAFDCKSGGSCTCDFCPKINGIPQEGGYPLTKMVSNVELACKESAGSYHGVNAILMFTLFASCMFRDFLM
jgi:hypothetical protein